MAYVDKVILDVGHTERDPFIDYAEVSFEVQFTPTEVRLDIPVRVAIILIEQDRREDVWFEIAGRGGKHIDLHGLEFGRDANSDDIVGKFWDSIGEGPLITPGGHSLHEVSFRREWDFGALDARGREKFRALILLIPEIYHAFVISEAVDKELSNVGRRATHRSH